MARRCDDTVDKKRMNCCSLKHLFLEGVEQPKISPKNPRKALSDALLMSRFQNFNFFEIFSLQPHQDASMLVFVMELSATRAASDIAPVAINHAAVNQIAMSLWIRSWILLLYVPIRM